MMRKKAALHLDSRYATMIENAYYYSNPPEVKSESRKVRPPMHEYIRRLLYKDLSKITTEKVLRQMRKLKWDDVDVRPHSAVWFQIRSTVDFLGIHVHNKNTELKIGSFQRREREDGLGIVVGSSCNLLNSQFVITHGIY